MTGRDKWFILLVVFGGVLLLNGGVWNEVIGTLFLVVAGSNANNTPD